MKASHRILYLVLLMAFTLPVNAHQSKESITSILYNARSGYLEIAHRFSVHDAEQAIKELLDEKADLIKSTNTREKFAQYISDRFLIALDQEALSKIEIIGHELEGKFFWVYQEIPIPHQPAFISVYYDALMEVWPSQRNRVNIEGLGKTRTMELTSSAKRAQLRF